MWRHLYDVMNPSRWLVFVTHPASGWSIKKSMVPQQREEQDG